LPSNRQSKPANRLNEWFKSLNSLFKTLNRDSIWFGGLKYQFKISNLGLKPQYSNPNRLNFKLNNQTIQIR
jgi:hypothetical protein